MAFLNRCAKGDTSIDESSPMASQEGLLSSKRGKNADWSSCLKPSHTDAFNWDSGPVKEARSCYFTTHPWDWVNSNTKDLSDIFRELAQGAGLLGESIHEDKTVMGWTGGIETHANYVLRSLPKGLKFLRVVSTKESPKVMGLKGIHDPDALQCILPVILTALGVAKTDRMRGPSSIIWGQYITGWVSFVTNASVVPWWCQTPSSNMDAILAQIKVLSPERVHSAHPIQSPPKEVKGMSFTRPPPLGRPASLTKKVLTAPFHLNQPCQQANTFHLRPWPELPHKDTADHN